MDDACLDPQFVSACDGFEQDDESDAHSDISASVSGSSMLDTSPIESPNTYMANLEEKLMGTWPEFHGGSSLSLASTAPSPAFDDEDVADLCEEQEVAVVGPAPDIDVEQPSAPVKATKSRDPVKEAMKRVRQRQRKEAKERKKARKREKKLAKKRRGANEDLEAFLTRTAERLNARAVDALEEAARAHMAARAMERPKRGSGIDVQDFLAKTRGRVVDKAVMAEAVAAAEDAAKAAQAAAAAASTELEEFRKQTRERLVRNMFAKLPQVQMGLVSPEHLDDATAAVTSLFLRRKIAVVGAGPVGLWTAVLLAEKYRAMEKCPTLARRPDAPDIVVIESRPKESHCTRTDIRIALSTSTQHLLNGRTKSRSFTSGMPIADIESALLRRLRKIAPQIEIVFGRPIAEPAELLLSDGFDCVLWAGGRRSLEDDTRQSLGCSMHLSEAERVLVFQFGSLQPGCDTHADLSMPVQQAAKRPALRVLVRPGVEGVCAGWLWLFGLPDDAIAKRRSREQHNDGVPASFTEALESVLDQASPCASSLLAAAAALQHRLRPAECTARWVDAAYWSADRAVCDLGSVDSNAAGSPLVLLGDSLCGKPFFTGTTLNSHLKDVATLVDELDWTHDGTPLTCSRFQPFERRYQREIQRISHYERRNVAAPPQPSSRPSPPPLPQGRLRSPVVSDDVTLTSRIPALSKTVSLPQLGTAVRRGGSPMSSVASPTRVGGRADGPSCASYASPAAEVPTLV